MFAGTDEEAETRLSVCENEIAKAGGELVRGNHGKYTLKGFLTRWKIIQIMDGLGFNLSEIHTLVRGMPDSYSYQDAPRESQQEYFGK